MNDEEKILQLHSTGTVRKQPHIVLMSTVIVLAIIMAFTGGVYVSSLTPQTDVPDTIVAEETEDGHEMVQEVEEVLEETVIDQELWRQGIKSITVEWIPVESQEQGDLHADLEKLFWAGASESELEEYVRFSKPLGTVQGGGYDGYTLTMELTQIKSEFTIPYVLLYVLEDPSGEAKPVVLNRYVYGDYYVSNVDVFEHGAQLAFDVLPESVSANIKEYFDFDDMVIIPEFERGQVIKDVEGYSYALQGVSRLLEYPRYSAIDLTDFDAITIFDSGEKVYLFPKNEKNSWLTSLYFTVREDGRIVAYDGLIPFWPTQMATSAIPEVRWQDGVFNVNTYTKGRIGGCGLVDYTHVVDKSDIGELEEVGLFRKDGVEYPIWQPADFSNKYYQSMFTNFTYFNAEATLEDFKAIKPVFYYQDVHGRWIEFMNVDIIPPGECS